MEIQYSVHVRRLGGVVTKWLWVVAVVILGQETFSLLPMPSDAKVLLLPCTWRTQEGALSALINRQLELQRHPQDRVCLFAAQG